MPKKGDTLMKWVKAEKEALCRRLALDNVQNNVPIDTHAVYALSKLEGQPWRRRESKTIAPNYYKKFLQEQHQQIEKFVNEYRAQAQAAVEAAAPPAPAEPIPAAPPAEVPETLPAVQPEPPAQIEAPRFAGNMTIGQIVDAAFTQSINDALAAQAQQITAGLQQVLSEAFKSIPGFTGLPVFDQPAANRKRTVLVANADTKQIESIQREFPFLDVVGMDRVIPEDVQPDLVVGINLFGSDGLDKRLRKRFGRDYAPAFGGADGAKRVIGTRLVDPRLVPKKQLAIHH